MRCVRLSSCVRTLVLLLSMFSLFALAEGGTAVAATKIPVDLEVDATGAEAENFGHRIEKYLRGSNFYMLDKKRVPRIGISVNAASKDGQQVVTYAIVLTVTSNKCPLAFVGTIFGDTTNEPQGDLENKLEKAIMAVAKEFNL